MSGAESPRSSQFPLTVYDALGYIVPGGLFLLSVFLFDFWAAHQPIESIHGPQPQLVTPLYSVLARLYSQSIREDWLITLIFGLSLLATTYAVGHIIASVSSCLIDRLLVSRGYGYPYATLLSLDRDQEVARPPYRAYWRGLFFWVLVTSTFGYASLYSTLPYSLDLPYDSFTRAAHLGGWIIASGTTVRILLAVFSRLQLQESSFRIAQPIMALFSLPSNLLGRGISEMLRARLPFDKSFLKRYEETFRGQFTLDYRLSSTNNFWLSYIFVVSQSRVLGSMLANWLTLYGFARNLSAAFFMSFAYVFVQMSMQRHWITQPMDLVQMMLVVYPVALLGCGGLMLIRYYYLFDCYYSRFVFRAFVGLQQSAEVEGRLREAA